MALTKLNNRSISAVTELPFNLTDADMPFGSVIKFTTYNPSNSVTTNTGSYADLQTITHTASADASSLYVIYTQSTNTHDGGVYNYGTHRVVVVTDVATYESQRVRTGMNTGGDHSISDNLYPVPGHLYVPQITGGTNATIKIQAYLDATQNGSGSVSGNETWVTVMDIR